jgi:hypothetical protein
MIITMLPCEVLRVDYQEVILDKRLLDEVYHSPLAKSLTYAMLHLPKDLNERSFPVTTTVLLNILLRVRERSIMVSTAVSPL